MDKGGASQYDTVIEVIRGRRHLEKFKPDPLPEGALEKLIEAARWAPSANNAQPWEFILVKSERLVREVVDALRRPSAAAATVPPVQSYPQAVIVILGDPRFKESYPENADKEEVFTSSIAAAIQNIHLAAAALGLATSWGTVRRHVVEPLRRLLKVPEPLEIRAALRVGYPSESPPPRYKKGLDELIHTDHYDESRMKSDQEVQEFIETKAKGWSRL